MIPTSVTSLPATATASMSISNTNTNSGQQNSSSVIIGIASLILEGRAISDYEYCNQSLLRNNLDCETSSVFNMGLNSAGRQSPKPSTSRAAVSAGSGSVINITTNPNSFGSTTASVCIDPNNSSSASSSAESTHQRWAQKLCQLRQASPAASISTTYKHKVAVENQSTSSEPELIALTLNELSSNRSDFEIVRRVMLNRLNASTANPSNENASTLPGSGSDNFLHSLQSLATTCLRGGNPSLDSAYRYSVLSTSPQGPPVMAIATPKSTYRGISPRFQCPYTIDVPGSASSSGSGIQSPRPTPSPASNIRAVLNTVNSKETFMRQTSVRVPIPATVTSYSHCTEASSSISSNSISPSSPSKYPQQGPHCDQFLRKMGLAKGEIAEAEDHICDMSYVNITCSRWRAYCLKMEAIIARGEPVCIEVYLGPVGHKILLEQWVFTQNEKVPPPNMSMPSLCSAIRSQLYFSQISAWCDLIKKSDRTIYDTGRIIIPAHTGAAGDLATHVASSSNMNSNANVTKDESSNLNTLPLNQRPRLNIFYRIKQYDSTACFNCKPNVHNFPNVNISENSSISVCLKSLPRINGGIPKVGTAMTSPIEEYSSANAAGNKSAISSNNLLSSFTPKSSRTSTLEPTTPTPQSNCDSKKINEIARTSSPLTTTTHVSTFNLHSDNGKHKCTFLIDEEESGADEADAGDEDDENNSDFPNGTSNDSSNSSLSSNANLSHREKQLLKYRKHMHKRDKKHHRRPLLIISDVTSFRMSDRSQREGTNSYIDFHQQPMDDSGDKEPPTGHIEMISTGTQTSMTCCQQCGNEKTLVCVTCNIHDGADDIVPTETEDMDSTYSSTSSSDIIHTPRNKAELLLQAILRTPKAAKYKKQASLNNAVTNDTPPQGQNNNHNWNTTVITAKAGCHVCKRQKTQHNFSGRAAMVVKKIVPKDDNDKNDEKIGEAYVSSFSTPGKEVNQTMEEQESFVSSTKLTPNIDCCSLSTCPLSSTEINRIDLAGGDYVTNTKCYTRSCMPPAASTLFPECNVSAAGQFKTPTSCQQLSQKQAFLHKQTPKPNLLEICDYHSSASGDGINTTYSNSWPALTSEATPPPKHIPIFMGMRKGLPKVNLTPIFCNPAATVIASLSAPISISSPDTTFSFEPQAIKRTTCALYLHATTTAVDNTNLQVQKSYSAPTLPNSQSLSPRFSKQAAIYKRRSRHLSDRSDRSSLGSDEQFSDEDLECSMYSPVTSPMKHRLRIAASFGHLPLLGNLEESLLQKRLVPKMEVMGFKVLLGASGGFCPTQLTIPAPAYFYELRGEALSTPYVCDIHLPRKGYTVPRTGTVQATLLNPMGTVVRMFVIPYDMRDMPPLHQTFIRQRILAEASINNNNINNSSISKNVCGGDSTNKSFEVENVTTSNNIIVSSSNNNENASMYRISPSGGLHGESNLGHFISADHMKRLRYSIHLRFQTSRNGRLSLHTDIRLLISRRTDCDTAAAHAKGVLEAPNDLLTDTVMPINPKYSARQESQSKI